MVRQFMQKPWTTIQDAILCERINQGDADAFGEAYDRYAPRLYRHLRLRTSSHEIAEDLLSKVFLQVWEYVRGGKTLRYLQSFLYTVTHNALTDHYRRAAHAAVPVADMTEFDQPAPDATVPMIDASFDRAVLEQGLEKLKREYRDVLVMRYVDDMEIPEMTKVLEVSANALYIRMHRALRALREVLIEKHEQIN